MDRLTSTRDDALDLIQVGTLDANDTNEASSRCCPFGSETGMANAGYQHETPYIKFRHLTRAGNMALPTAGLRDMGLTRSVHFYLSREQLAHMLP